MKNLFLKIRKGYLAVCCLFLSSVLTFAQSNIGQNVLTETTSALSGLVVNVVKLLQVVMGLGALVVLAMVIFKVFKGDREAAEKLAWWIAGLTIGFVLLTVVSGLIPA